MISAACAGIVLAAGSSVRMGKPKQLLSFRGRPLLESVVTSACASRLDDVVVVLGAERELIVRRVRWGRARIIVNADHASGMSSSLRAGLAALAPDVGSAMVILGDQPGIGFELLDRLLEELASSGQPVAALSVHGLLQPPAVFRRDVWDEVMALSGDSGARGLIRAHPEMVASVVVDADAEHLTDVDTPDDWRRYRSSTPSPRS